MKSRSLLTLATVLALTFSAAHAADAPAATDVALYLSPDAATPVALQVKSDDAALNEAKPAAKSANVADGWQMVEYKGKVPGFVPATTSRKDMSVAPGTTVHLTADDKSPVLGETKLDPLTMIKAVHGDWAEVDFAGPTILYFQKAVAAVAPAVTPATAAKTETPATTTTKTAPAATTPTPTLTEPTHPVATTPTTPTPAVVQTSPAKASNIAPAQFYQGVLQLRTNPKIAGPINAEYLLVGDNGQLIALVDLNHVVVPNPITTYLDKTVKIYGTTQPTPDFPFALINAQLLQLK